MSDSDAIQSNGQRSKHSLSTGKLVGLLVPMCIVPALLAAGLGTWGNEVAGEPGKWAGMVAAFVALCVVCWFVYSRFSHPQLALVCSIVMILGASKVGEEIGRDIGGEFATRWSGSIAMAIAFMLCFVVGGLLDKSASDND